MKIAVWGFSSPKGFGYWNSGAVYAWGLEQLGYEVVRFRLSINVKKGLAQLRGLKVDVIFLEICSLAKRGLAVKKDFWLGLNDLIKKGQKIVLCLLDEPRAFKLYQNTVPKVYKGFMWNFTSQLKEKYTPGLGYSSYLPIVGEHPVYETSSLEVPKGKKVYDLVFNGSLYSMRIDFLRALKERLSTDINFKICSQKVSSDLKNYQLDPKQFGLFPHDQLFKIYSQTKILLLFGIYADALSNLSLNDLQHLDTLTTRSWAYPCRIFSMVASGSFVLADWRVLVKDYFEPGKEMDCYRSIDECVEKIQYYLKHEEEREEIAKRGRERFLKEHTIEKRMAKVLEECLSYYNSK